MIRQMFLRLTLLTAAVSLCSCASVKVTDVSSSHSAGSKAPRKVYVTPFSLAGANLKEHPMRKHPGQLGPEAQKLVADYLVSEISKSLAPATLVSSPAAAGHDGWVITGQFTRINEGSRILRMAIGLGAGGTKMETKVAVQAAGGKAKPFLQFTTSGGSGSGPGAATNPVPFSSGPTALIQSRLGVSDDSARTARVITNRLLAYLGRPPANSGGLVPRKPGQ